MTAIVQIMALLVMVGTGYYLMDNVTEAFLLSVYGMAIVVFTLSCCRNKEGD